MTYRELLSECYQRKIVKVMAGLPALHGGEPGQVRKEAAKTIFCKCRGKGSPPNLVDLSRRLKSISHVNRTS